MVVLLVLDAADESHELLEYVRSVHRVDADLVLLSISLSGREADRAVAERVLTEALQTLGARPGPGLSARMEIGDPADVIARVVDEERPDVIMMPAYGDGDFPRLQELGTLAREIAHRTNIPLVIASPAGLEALLRDERIVTLPSH
jgi:nucleotide-binding universal stress UspA family protein